MESPKRPACSTGSEAAAPKKKNCWRIWSSRLALVGPGVPVGRYPNIWCPNNHKKQPLQSLWDGFSKVCLSHSLGWFCSHHGSVRGAHSCLGTVCAHMASLPDTALPCPCTGGSAHVTRPEWKPRLSMDLAKLDCFGCHFSHCKVTKGKSLGHCLCLLVLWKGLVQGPSVSATEVQRTICYKETLPGSSPPPG